MKDIKWIGIIALILIGIGFWMGWTSHRPKTIPGTVTTIPGSVEIRYEKKYIPVESKVDLTPLYDEIAQLKLDRDGLLAFIDAIAQGDTTVHAPVIADRPLPKIKYPIAGFGLWPGIAASLNYKNNSVTPSGCLTLQCFYLHRFTLGVQANTKEAGLNLGYHLPPFRNLQVKVLVNKEFRGKSIPDNYGIGLGVNF